MRVLEAGRDQGAVPLARRVLHQRLLRDAHAETQVHPDRVDHLDPHAAGGAGLPGRAG